MHRTYQFVVRVFAASGLESIEGVCIQGRLRDLVRIVDLVVQLFAGRWAHLCQFTWLNTVQPTKSRPHVTLTSREVVHSMDRRLRCLVGGFRRRLGEPARLLNEEVRIRQRQGRFRGITGKDTATGSGSSETFGRHTVCGVDDLGSLDVRVESRGRRRSWPAYAPSSKLTAAISHTSLSPVPA